MNKIIKIIISASIFILLTACMAAPTETALNDEITLKNNNLECLYFEPADFINVKQFKPHEEGILARGAILPHHLLASDLIHEVFQNVKNQKYETVVLIGPDHESIYMGKVFTSLSNWQTPMGILKADEHIIKELLRNDFLVEDNKKLTKEHSVSGIVPFVKYYFKDAKIVPLVMTKQTKPKDVDKLVEDLSGLINIEKTLFISSVDFSHYLDLECSDKMDAISMEAIKNKDINKIMSFTNDNMDSPVSIATMLKMMEKLNAANQYILNHSNSELILKRQMDETTSYITYLFN